MSTATATAPAPSVDGTSDAMTGRSLWRSLRWPLAALLVLVLVSIGIALLRSTRGGNLDPRSYQPEGTHALATLVEGEGVPVRTVGDLGELGDQLRPGSRVVLADVQTITQLEADRLGSLVESSRGSSLLVAGAGSGALDALGVRADTAGSPSERVRSPGCDLAPARRAGAALSGGRTYELSRGATGCYLAGGDPTLLVLAGGRTTLLGSPALLTNAHLSEDGNAALGIGLLTDSMGAQAPTQVLWLVPRSGRAIPTSDRSLGDLVPRGVWWAVLQLALAVVALALWRGRRLGRVVPERLPVVVRGAETVEGRARLYQAAGSRAQAAEALRAGTRNRLTRSLSLPVEAGRTTLVETLSRRGGHDPQRVDALLYGPAPLDDAALVRLADDLDALTPERP